MIRHLGLVVLLLTLSACAYFQGKSSDHDALCQQLKGQIVMNGANVIDRKANMQRAEKSKLIDSYRKEGCE